MQTANCMMPVSSMWSLHFEVVTFSLEFGSPVCFKCYHFLEHYFLTNLWSLILSMMQMFYMLNFSDAACMEVDLFTETQPMVVNSFEDANVLHVKDRRITLFYMRWYVNHACGIYVFSRIYNCSQVKKCCQEKFEI